MAGLPNACTSHTGGERIEDAFNDIIATKLRDDQWSHFARSRHGLILDDDVIDPIVPSFSSITYEQKYQLLRKWKSMNENSTAASIREIVNRYLNYVQQRESATTSQATNALSSNNSTGSGKVVQNIKDSSIQAQTVIGYMENH